MELDRMTDGSGTDHREYGLTAVAVPTDRNRICVSVPTVWANV